MKDEDKTKEQLLAELAEMRQQVAELEASETERKRAEETLRRTEQEKAAILDSMSELVAYQDTEMRVLWANRAVGKADGLAPEQLVGRHCYEAWAQRSKPCVGCPVEKALKIGQPQEGEMTSPGGGVWFVRGYPVRDASGDVVGIVEVTLDITERKRAEEEIRRRKAQLEALRQVGLDLTAQLDLDALLHSIVSRAIELVGGTCGGLYLYRPEEGVLEWAMAVGPHLVPIGTVLHQGEGLSGKVWETGELLIVDDYQHWERRAAVYEGYPFKAVVGVPVRWGEEFLGVLNVLADSPRIFLPTDAELLSLFATQAATAIRNARLYEETRRRALEQETVSRIAYALNTPDVRDAFPVLVEGLHELTGCDLVSLIAMDEAGEQFIMSVLEPPFPPPVPPNLGGQGGEEGDVMPLSATAAAEDIEAGRPHLTADLSTETHFSLEQTLYQAGLRSRVTLPLLVGGEVFGALNLGGSHTGLFQEDQLPVLRQIADAVALALENSLLFQTERERRELAEALEETTAALTTTLDFDLVLDRILEQVSRVVPNDAANIMLIREGDQTRIVRWRGYERFGVEEFVSTIVFRIPEVANLQQMLDSGEPLVIPDTATYPGWVQVPMMEWLRSYTGAPIIARGEVIGFLNVYSATSGFFTQAHAEALRAFAGHAAAAIENARLFEAERERSTQLSAVAKVAERIASILNPDELLRETVELITQTFGYYYAAIMLLDAQANELVFNVGAGGYAGRTPAGFRQNVKEGMIGWAAHLGETVWANDVSQEPRYIPAYLSETRSELDVPLKYHDRVIGVLDLQSRELNAFTRHDVMAMETLAGHVAAALENARLYEAERRRIAELETLRQASLHLTSALDLRPILEAILDHAFKLVAADDVHVFLYDGERLAFGAALWGDGRQQEPYAEPRPQGLTYTVARSGERTVVPDVSSHPLFRDWPWGGSIVGLPLRVGERVVGVMNVAFERPHAFDESELRVLGLLADQAAIAIENARLYEETRQRALEQETLREAVLALTTALDRNEVIDRILAQLQQVVPYDSASVQLLREDRMELVGGRGFPNLPDLLGISFPTDGDNPNSVVIRTRAPFIVEDARTVYEGFRKGPHLQTVIRSWLGVPMLIGEQLVGMIALDKSEPGFYTQEHARLAEAFAAQAAIAIENARLFEETERLKAFNEGIVQGMSEGITVEDAEGYLTFVNPATAAMLGYSPTELVGQHWTIIVPPDQQPIVQAADERRARGEADRYELELIRKDGTRVPVLISGSPRFEGGRFAGTLTVYTNITQRKRMEETLRALALVDDLTNLYNRRGFFTLAEQQLKTADRTKRRMVLLFADFDGLKQINDALGHSEGDRALIETAHVFRETFRESDIIARMGGDEFVVLAAETSKTSANAIATRLQEKLEAHNAREGRRYELSLSMGLARYDPEHPCSLDELLAQADRAMYERKQRNHQL